MDRPLSLKVVVILEEHPNEGSRISLYYSAVAQHAARKVLRCGPTCGPEDAANGRIGMVWFPGQNVIIRTCICKFGVVISTDM